MANTVRNPYSNTAGNVPSSLGNGQIGVNQADGRLFCRTAAGAVQAVSSVLAYETVAAFPATGTSNTIYVDSSTSRLFRWESPIYVETGPVGGGGSGGSTTDASALTSGTLSDALLSANVVLTGDARLTNSRTPTSHAASHAAAGSDPLTLSAGQVSGLATVATSGSYADLSNKPSVPSADTIFHPFLLMGG